MSWEPKIVAFLCNWCTHTGMDRIKSPLASPAAERGIVTMANLIVGTTNNCGPITMSIQRAAKSLIQRGKEVSEGILDMVEMAFRAHGPCFGCATHTLPGQMPLIVRIRNGAEEILRELRRD